MAGLSQFARHDELHDILARKLYFGKGSVPHHVEQTNFWNDPLIENSILISRFRYFLSRADYG